MAVNGRNKGAAAERAFAKRMAQSGVKLERNLTQSRNGGYDLVVKPDAVGPVADAFRGLAIECKSYSKASPGLIRKWWEQAKRQAVEDGKKPVLAYKSNYQDWRVVVPVDFVSYPFVGGDWSLERTVTMAPELFVDVVLLKINNQS